MASHPQTSGSSAGTASKAVPVSAHGSELKVALDPPNKVFYLTADAQMPKIKVSCTMPAPTAKPVTGASALSGAAGAPSGSAQSFDWDVSLVLNPAGVPYAVGRTTRHAPIHVTTAVAQLAIPFTQTRGGSLTVTVTTTFEGKRITGKATAEILGTNPSSTLIRAEGVNDLLLKLMSLESNLRQFLSTHAKAGYPLFSHDGRGGVGLGQITNPRPTDDQVWDWKANVKAAKAQWNSTRNNDAGRILRKYPTGSAFRALVDAYNKTHTAAPAAKASPATAKTTPPAPPLKALTITLPAITDEMIDNETLRLYNGAPVVQEYVAETDANGLLVVDVDKDGLHGTARWHQVTAAERRALYVAHGMKAETGDPDYVNDVRAQVVN
jgi:hypothetical protein